MNPQKSGTVSTSANEKSPRQLIAKGPLWKEARVKKISFGDAVIVPLYYGKGAPSIKVGKIKQALPLDDISYLMMYKNKEGLIQTEVVTWMPDDDYWDDLARSKKKFKGIVIVENWNGGFIKGFHFNNDGMVSSLKHSKSSNSGNEIQDAYEECYTVAYWVCFGPDNTYCTSKGYDTYCTSNDDPGTGGGEPGGSGGGGTAPSDYPPTNPNPSNPSPCDPVTVYSKGNTVSIVNPDCYEEPQPNEPAPLPATFTEAELANATVVPDDKPGITDIDKFIDCFTNGQAGTYKLTIYVDQPVANRNDQFLLWPMTSPSMTGVRVNINGVIYDNGHTFVGFEKANTDGTITRQVLGFYPGSSGASPKGVIKDDSGRKYDVSYSVTVDADYFSDALNRVQSDHNNAYYKLSNIINNEYNCVDAAKLWLSIGGALLPSAPRGVFNNTPGDFGQALRGKPGANLNSGTAPTGKGPCN